MARGQITRLTQRTVVASEEAHDYVVAAAADGLICEMEQAEIIRLTKTSYAVAMEADEAFGIGMSVMRGGVRSGWAKRQGFNPAVTG